MLPPISLTAPAKDITYPPQRRREKEVHWSPHLETSFTVPHITTHLETSFTLPHITTRKRSCGKVMLSQASVCWRGGGVGTSHTSWDRSHGRVPPSAWTSYLGTYPYYWHLVVITGDMGPTPPRYQTLGPIPLPLLLTFGGHHYRPVQTCSLEDLPSPRCYWTLVVATETHTVSKRVVHILLEYCLVWKMFPLPMHVLLESLT